MKKIIGIVSGMMAVLLFTVVVFAADATVVVTGDTSPAENESGWMFNRDASTSTPYEFSTDAASIGEGSLYVEPIGTNPSDKFVAENFLKQPVSELNSISYDFLIAGNGDSADAEQFYLNVYATTDNSNKFYDCRFDYVPATGSVTDFTTATFASNDIPVNVLRSSTARIATCPPTLAGMPEGSYVRAFSISVGDTSTSDIGLAGYLDNVVVDLDSGVTAYDFEPIIRNAEITAPTAGEEVSGVVDFAANLVDDDVDSIQWAVRQGTCAAGTNTVFGNVDGHNDVATINTDDPTMQTFSFTGDMSTMDSGAYCFIYNPVEDSGESDIRETVEFSLQKATPTGKNECKDGGWKTFSDPSFKNQGDCVSYIQSNERASGNKNK